MFGESLDLSDVLKKLKRADESLTEFVAPLWPGVSLAAVWMEGAARLFHLTAAPEHEGYFLLGTQDEQATIVREADENEARQYRNYLERAAVILLENELAFPASYAERLQGITFPRPIHFAQGKPLEQVAARFDGVNLFFEGKSAKEASPFATLFGESSIFTPGELLGVPGKESAGGEAQQALEALHLRPDLAIEYRLRAVVEPAGAVLEAWSRADDALRVQWRLQDKEHAVTLPSPATPITSGICLPGARGFDPGRLTRLLLDHLLDVWSQ